MMRWLALFVVMFFNSPLRAENYVIGIEQIDYYPHYDFSRRQQRGYFVDLIQLFSEKTGHQFKFMPLPVKRLYQSANSGIDLIYPDNPLWLQYNEPGIAKSFSAPVVTDEFSGYSKTIAWIDQKDYKVLKVEYYDKKNALLKTLQMLDYQLYLNKFWRPLKLSMVNHQTGKSTDLLVHEIQFGKGRTEADFDTNALMRAK